MNKKELTKYKNNTFINIRLSLSELDLLCYLCNHIPIEYKAIIGTTKLLKNLNKRNEENK